MNEDYVVLCVWKVNRQFPFDYYHRCQKTKWLATPQLATGFLFILLRILTDSNDVNSVMHTLAELVTERGYRILQFLVYTKAHDLFSECHRKKWNIKNFQE